MRSICPSLSQLHAGAPESMLLPSRTENNCGMKLVMPATVPECRQTLSVVYIQTLTYASSIKHSLKLVHWLPSPKKTKYKTNKSGWKPSMLKLFSQDIPPPHFQALQYIPMGSNVPLTLGVGIALIV